MDANYKFYMDLSHGWKTVWILISWLHRKQADLDIHSFQKRVSYTYFEEKKVCNVSFWVSILNNNNNKAIFDYSNMGRFRQEFRNHRPLPY